MKKKKEKKSTSKIEKSVKKNLGEVKPAAIQLFIIVAIVAIIIGLIILTIGKIISNNTNTKAKDIPIIVEVSYSNFAEQIQYDGSIILNNGVIYSWTFNGSMHEYDSYFSTKDKLVKYAKENGNKVNKKVSQEDLSLLTKKSKKIKDDIKIGCISNPDMVGTKSYYVKNSNGMIALSSSGQCIGENENSNTKDVLKIINKYINE